MNVQLLWCRRSIARVVLAGAMVGAAGQVAAADPTAVAGTNFHKSGKIEVLVEDTKAGRFVTHVPDIATVRETSRSGLFDGATGPCRGFWDTTNGIGDGRGMCTMSKGADSYVIQWTGTCYTVKGKDGESQDRCSGGWALLPSLGAGRFSGVRGSGAWWGRALPSGDFDEQWNGYYGN